MYTYHVFLLILLCFIVSFKHTATPVLFTDDSGELASDEESCSVANTSGNSLPVENTEQVGGLHQVVS